MRQKGLCGVILGKAQLTTFIVLKAAPPLNLVKRQFKADRPNKLWVSDPIYFSNWQRFVYVAFVIYVFSRRIVGR